MALFFLVILSVVGAISALGNWRSGLIWMFVIAAVQDPLRKLVPGSPGSLLLISNIVFLATAIGLISSRRNLWGGFQFFFPDVVKSLGWFVLACVPAAFISLFYGPESWVFTVFGIFSYGIILSSILIGFYYLQSEKDLRRLLAAYCLVTAVALGGTFFEYFRIDYFGDIVGTRNLHYDWIRYNGAHTIQLLSGFYRSPDVMGWHASAAAMLSLLLAFSGKGTARWNWLFVTLVAISALMVSGRRKMVYMVPFFVLMTLLLILQNRRRGLDIQTLFLILIPLALVLTVKSWLGADSDFIRYYVDNPDDVVVQAQRHGIDSVIGTFQQSGFWGLGLGFASPGAHNIPFPAPRVWQESGLSRVTAELGIPGLFMLTVFVVKLIQACLFTSSRLYLFVTPYDFYSVSLLAFLVSNFASLSISGQILSDPFIASFIGLMIGMQLSLARLAHSMHARNQQQTQPISAAQPVT